MSVSERVSLTDALSNVDVLDELMLPGKYFKVNPSFDLLISVLGNPAFCFVTFFFTNFINCR